jgi:hypothetical protein
LIFHNTTGTFIGTVRQYAVLVTASFSSPQLAAICGYGFRLFSSLFGLAVTFNRSA